MEARKAKGPAALPRNLASGAKINFANPLHAALLIIAGRTIGTDNDQLSCAFCSISTVKKQLSY
jgi:hypothetical protein